MTYNHQMAMLVRFGFTAHGLVYLLIGWFALGVASNSGYPPCECFTSAGVLVIHDCGISQG